MSATSFQIFYSPHAGALLTDVRLSSSLNTRTHGARREQTLPLEPEVVTLLSLCKLPQHEAAAAGCGTQVIILLCDYPLVCIDA